MKLPDRVLLKPTFTNLETPPVAPQPVNASTEVPVWLQRLFVIVYVVFCVELGLTLVVLPWTWWWDGNSLLAYWPAVRHLLQHGFVRGAISGLGFLDLWLGISEAIYYRDRRPGPS